MKTFVATSFVFLVVACASAKPSATPPPPRPMACSGRQAPLYARPGCGADAVAECADIPQPCAQTYCGCDGRIYTDFCGGRSSMPIAPDETCN